MENLELLGVQEMDAKQVKETEGGLTYGCGNNPDFCNAARVKFYWDGNGWL